jgi:hypothetical protein
MSKGQLTIAVKKETGRRLQILRGNKKWDDLMNILMDRFLGTIYSIALEKKDLEKQIGIVKGLKAFEIKTGDIINITGTPEEDNEDDSKFAMVTTVTPTERQNEVTAHIKYDWVKL